jgi:TonB family protein
LSEQRKYRNYTAEDIEKYHKGLLSPKEMNELERSALDDPFLADALEGYGSVSVNAGADLSELEKKLQERMSSGEVVHMPQVRSSFKWWRVAAAAVIIAGLGFLTFLLFTNDESKEIALVKEKKNVIDQTQPSTIARDSNTLQSTEGLSVTTSNKKTGTVPAPSVSQKNKPGSFSNAITDTIANNDFVASESAPIPSAPRGVKFEKYDSTAAPGTAATSRETFAKGKAPTQNARLSEVYPAKQQNEMGLRDEQKMNFFRGRVVDPNNNPLPFANITNTKDSVGTYTDVRGFFNLLSPDSTLDVQVRSIGFESNHARLKNNVASNQVILQEDKALPDKIISYKKTDTVRSRAANVQIEEPEPADGWSNYDLYVANNINVTDDLRKKTLTGGEVRLSFDINQNGDPTNIRVEKSLCKECDEEAVRLIKEGPKWKKKNKKTKRVTINIPFDPAH